jgi:hypothetical protein
VHQRDQRALKLGAARAGDGVGREGLPDDRLADVGRDEERDAAAQAVALLQQLVEADDDDAGEDELGDDEAGVDGAEVADVAVHAGDDIGDGLADGDQDAEQLLRALEQVAVRLDAVVDVDDLGAGQQLHHHGARDDRANAQLHAGPAVGRHDHARPVEGVGALGRLDAVEGQLTADQEHEERHHGVHKLLLEGDLALGGDHLWQERQERPH